MYQKLMHKITSLEHMVLIHIDRHCSSSQKSGIKNHKGLHIAVPRRPAYRQQWTSSQRCSSAVFPSLSTTDSTPHSIRHAQSTPAADSLAVTSVHQGSQWLLSILLWQLPFSDAAPADRPCPCAPGWSRHGAGQHWRMPRLHWLTASMPSTQDNNSSCRLHVHITRIGLTGKTTIS